MFVHQIHPTLLSHRPSPNPKTRAIRTGFVNKGNTCYANSILQILSVLPSVWSKWASESQVCPLIACISRNVSALSSSKTAIDPSDFLRALQKSMRELQISILIGLKMLRRFLTSSWKNCVVSLTQLQTCLPSLFGLKSLVILVSHLLTRSRKSIT